jgi:hypothetical protein
MVTQEHFEVVENYVNLITQAKAATQAAELLKAEVQAVVAEAGGKLEVNGANLSLGHRKKWSYPYPVEEMEAELKSAKKQAETDDEATFESTDYLICKV